MRLKPLLNSLKHSLAIILALLMIFTLIGCSEQDISNAIDVAEQILDIADSTDTEQIRADGTADDETTLSPPEETTEAVPTQADPETAENPETEKAPIDENGYYYTRDEVALYIHTYNKLPSNFITKSEAEDLGWEGGSVERYLEGAAIGGDKFGNREGILPNKNGRVYRECDIDTNGGKPRGAKRIVYSNDGLIYYTDDHYESFTLLYGEE